jgi:hypothetical protein
MYRLHAPGFLIDDVKPPAPDPLAAVQYSCIYWVDHLLDCGREETTHDLKDSGSVHQFLRESYIYWLEALSLIKSVSDSIIMIINLENWLQVSSATIFENVISESLANLTRPIKVQIYMRSCVTQGGSLYTTDRLLNKPPFNYTARRLSSPQEKASFGNTLRSASPLGSKRNR